MTPSFVPGTMQGKVYPFLGVKYLKAILFLVVMLDELVATFKKVGDVLTVLGLHGSVALYDIRARISPDTSLPNPGGIIGHGFDFGVPGLSTYISSVIAESLPENHPVARTLVTLGPMICSVFYELGQKYSVLPGTYDPIDLVAHVAGPLVTLGILQCGRKLRDRARV